ncbi:MAG: chitobiase/beta-hexosaminidase C-terminal domain-containing protein [Edaphobacter sp.]
MQVLRRIVSRPIALAIVLTSVLAMSGCGGTNPSNSTTNATATPTFNPGAGSYNTSQTVTIADSTAGAVLYCTTDGTTPTTSSPQCGQPTTVFKTQFLQAIAVAPGKSPSLVASAGYTINLNAAATPTFSPAGGSYTAAQTVAISDATTGANLYYTTDGSVPTASSTLYTGPVTLSKTATLSAIAIASGFSNSGVASASYVIGTATAPPVISPSGGTFTSAQSIIITDATSGANIYYTTDGSIPTSSSTPYSGPISVSVSGTITAIAVASSSTSSPVTASFVINIPAAATPTFNPSAGTYSSAQQVILSDTTPSAVIYYTTDGSTPSISSSVYSSPINVSASETLKAIATAPGFGTSAVASAAYTINVVVPPPTISPAGGTYTTAQSVTLSETNASATIYYTTDGSTPTTSSTVYNPSNPIQVGSGTTTVTAIAAVGSAVSTPASASYTINLGPSLSGKVLSGTLPVAGSSVQLYAAGQGGYGTAATLLTTTAATSGSDGSFTLNFNCPASPGDLVYVIATGGHTGSNTASNAALAFMGALGSCNGTLPSPLVVNEATTAASAYALSQFMTGATNVGSASSQQGIQGITNAFKTVNNLVDLTTGAVRDHTPAYPTNLAGDTTILNNSTVPQARINTLANVLNLCAVDGGGCSSLFSAATIGTGTAPSDTLQAILNIAQNPGNNAGMVYNVAPTGPFTPALSATPNDWTVALTFTGGGLGFAPGIRVPRLDVPSSTGVFENSAIAIDAMGNIWVAGFNNGGSATNVAPDTESGMIAEFSNLGAPLTKASQLGSGGTTVTLGGFIPFQIANGGTQIGHSIAFDPSGNAWVLGGAATASGSGTSSGGAMSEITPGLSVAVPFIKLGEISPSPLVIDGVGNIWEQDVTLNMYDSTGTLKHSDAGKENGNTLGYKGIQSLVFDSNASTLWAVDPVQAGFLQVSQINPASGAVNHVYYPSFKGAFTPLVAGSAAGDGSPGNVYGCSDTGGQNLDVFNASSTTIVNAYPIPTGRGCGNLMAIDGLGHIFAVTGGHAPGIIDEISVTASGISMISPANTGYTGTSGGESPTINPDPNALNIFAGIPGGAGATVVKNPGVIGEAIDGSGNLWVLNANTGTTTSPGNVLVEYVGIAAPVVTPTSLALQFGQVGVRP